MTTAQTTTADAGDFATIALPLMPSVVRVAQALTGDDGRATLLSSGPIPVGLYELRFQTADYFRRQGVAVGNPAMLDMVVVRFSITDPTGHYHVPLIFTPTGYTTYRGS